jgi:DNA-binding MarR family transcriptional regulator
VLSLTEAGQQVLQDKRNARTRQLAEALATSFTPDEVRLLAQATPLLERLAQTI